MVNPHKFVYWVRSLSFSLFMYLKEKQYKIAMILLCPVQGPWASSLHCWFLRYIRRIYSNYNVYSSCDFLWRRLSLQSYCLTKTERVSTIPLADTLSVLVKHQHSNPKLLMLNELNTQQRWSVHRSTDASGWNWVRRYPVSFSKILA